MDERGRGFGQYLLLVAAGALVLRLIVIALHSNELPLNDGLWYHGEAWIIANGHGYLAPGEFIYAGEAFPTAEHPPLFPGILAAVTWIFHHSVVLHQVTCAAIGTAGVITIGLLGRRVGGERCGIAAAAIAALAPNVWQYETQLLSESLMVLTLGLFLLAVYRFRERPDRWRAAQLGFTLALAAYTRSELALLGLVIVVPLVVRTPGLLGAGARWGRLALAGATCLALMAPWSIRTLTVSETPVVFSNNLDSVIAGANCDATYYGPAVGTWVPRCNPTPPRRGEGQIEGYARARQKGLEYMGSHLRRLPTVMVFRAGRAWSLYQPFSDLGTDGRGVPLSVASILSFYALVVLGAIGAVRLRRQGRVVWPLVVLMPYVTVLAMVGYGVPRLRFPADIALLVLAAEPVAAAWSRWGNRLGRHPIAPSGGWRPSRVGSLRTPTPTAARSTVVASLPRVRARRVAPYRPGRAIHAPRVTAHDQVLGVAQV